MTVHEKTDHSPQNNFFQYEAIKSEEWPYLEIQFIPSMESSLHPVYSYIHARPTLPFNRMRVSLSSGRKYGPNIQPACKSEWSSRQATSD